MAEVIGKTPEDLHRLPKLSNILPKGTARWAASAVLSAGALLGGAYLLFSHDRGPQNPPPQPTTPSAPAFIPGPEMGEVVAIPTAESTVIAAVTAEATALPEPTAAVKEPVSPLPKGARVVTWKGLEDATIKIWTGKEWENRPIDQFKGPAIGLKGKEGAGSDLIGFEGKDDNFYVITAADGKNFRAALPKDLQTLENITAPTKTPVPAQPTVPARPSPAATTEAKPTVPAQPTAPATAEPTVATPPPTATIAPKIETPTPVAKELNLQIPGLHIYNMSGGNYEIRLQNQARRPDGTIAKGEEAETINRNYLADMVERYSNGKILDLFFFSEPTNYTYLNQARKTPYYFYYGIDGVNNHSQVYIALPNGFDFSDNLSSQQIHFAINANGVGNFLCGGTTAGQGSAPQCTNMEISQIYFPAKLTLVKRSSVVSELDSKPKITFINRDLSKPNLYGGISKDGVDLFAIREDDQAA